MGRRLRTFPPSSVVETTLRTVHRMFLLRPSPRLNRLIVGVVGRAQQQTGMTIYGFAFLSNHAHFLLRARSPAQLAAFQHAVASNIAREVCKVHDWSDKVFARRYSLSEVSHEPECQEERLLYILSQGVKERLVARAVHWPGATSTRALVRGDLTMRGVWVDRTALDAARRLKGRDRVSERDHSEEVGLTLTPLAHWGHEPAHRYAAHLRRQLRALEKAHAAMRRAAGARVLGKRAVLTADPHHSPGRQRRSPAPVVLAATLETWVAMKNRYLETVARYQNASSRFRRGALDVTFPPNTFPPAPWLVYDTS